MYYRAPDQSIHFLDDPRFAGMLPRGSVPMSDAEAAAARAPSPEEAVATFTAAIQAHLDAVAQAWGYDNIYTAATYAEEPAVKAFQDEGKALRAWRSHVWAAARQALADVQGGKQPAPTINELIASLPPAPVRG